MINSNHHHHHNSNSVKNDDVFKVFCAKLLLFGNENKINLTYATPIQYQKEQFQYNAKLQLFSVVSTPIFSVNPWETCEVRSKGSDVVVSTLCVLKINDLYVVGMLSARPWKRSTRAKASLARCREPDLVGKPIFRLLAHDKKNGKTHTHLFWAQVPYRIRHVVTKMTRGFKNWR